MRNQTGAFWVSAHMHDLIHLQPLSLHVWNGSEWCPVKISLLPSLDWVVVFLLSSVTHERQWHKHNERFYTYICSLKTIHTVMRDKTLLSSRDRSFCKSSWHQGSPSIEIQQGLRSCNRRRLTVLGRLVAAAVFVILEMIPLLLAGDPKANDWTTIRRRFKRRSRFNFLLHYRQVFFVKKMFPKLSQHHKKANARFSVKLLSPSFICKTASNLMSCSTKPWRK